MYVVKSECIIKKSRYALRFNSTICAVIWMVAECDAFRLLIYFEWTFNFFRVGLLYIANAIRRGNKSSTQS